MVKRHSVLKNPIKPKWTFSGGFAYLFFPHQTTLIWFFSLLLLLFPNIDINFVPPLFCLHTARGDKINMHSDGRIKIFFIVHWTLKFKSAKNAIWGLTSWNQIFLTEKKLIWLQCVAMKLWYSIVKTEIAAAYGLNEKLVFDPYWIIGVSVLLLFVKKFNTIEDDTFYIKTFSVKKFIGTLKSVIDMLLLSSWPHTDTYFAYLLTFFVPNHRTLLSMQDYLDWKLSFWSYFISIV